MPHTTIPTSIQLAATQQSIRYPSIHVPCVASDFTADSFADARVTSVIDARARDAGEIHSVSIVSFGAELGRPSTCLMFNSSHNVTKRFPSRCFVIKSAGLIVPRIFSILSSWFFSFCCSQKYLVSMCLIVPLPLRRANPRVAATSVQIRICALCPSSRIVLANPTAALAQRTLL